MRRGLQIVVGLLMAAVPFAGPATAVASKRARPVTLHLHWRVLVGDGPQFTTVSSHYVVYMRRFRPVWLLDVRNGRQTALWPPDCAQPKYGYPKVVFGYPSLLVPCGDRSIDNSDRSWELYNVATGQWSPFSVSDQCAEVCSVVAVGRSWAKINYQGAVPFPEKGPSYFLQNLRTGEFKPDPATPNGRLRDDLDTSTGSRALCSPLRYPHAVDGDDPELYAGSLNLYGPFALVNGRDLRRCGTRLNLDLYATTFGTCASSNDAVASSHAALQTADGFTQRGWYLPSLRPFTLRPDLGGCAVPIAIINRTIYVQSTAIPASRSRLWTATLPSSGAQTR